MRGHFADNCLHPRTAEIAADLLAAFDVFLVFAEDVGAISEGRSEQLSDQLESALLECIGSQNIQLKAQDPIEQLLELVAAALLCGRAHLTGMDGGAPQETGYGILSTWGWVEREEIRTAMPSDKTPATSESANQGVKEKTAAEKNDDPTANDPIAPTENAKLGTKEAASANKNDKTPMDNGAGSNHQHTVVTKRWPRGNQIGWIDGDNVYLDRETSLAEAQKLARDRGHHLAVGPKSLGKMLFRTGKPLTVNLSSEHPYQKWITVQGCRHRVYHISTSSLHKPVWWNEQANGDFTGLLDA